MRWWKQQRPGNKLAGIHRQREILPQDKGWQTSGVFSYAQNVQSLLVTYTTSYYNYSATAHRRLPGGFQWTAAFNGTHSGLTNTKGRAVPAERLLHIARHAKAQRTGNYTQATGISLLGPSGFVPVSGTPAIGDFITFGGSSYGGGVSSHRLGAWSLLAASVARSATLIGRNLLPQQHRNL